MATDWKMIVRWWDLKLDLKSLTKIDRYALYALFSTLVVNALAKLCKDLII